MFDGKVALITGGSAGIGLAVATRWVQLGGRAALVARMRPRLEAAVAPLGGEPKAVAFALDVTDLVALQKLPARRWWNAVAGWTRVIPMLCWTARAPRDFAI